MPRIMLHGQPGAYSIINGKRLTEGEPIDVEESMLGAIERAGRRYTLLAHAGGADGDTRTDNRTGHSFLSGAGDERRPPVVLKDAAPGNGPEDNSTTT